MFMDRRCVCCGKSTHSQDFQLCGGCFEEQTRLASDVDLQAAEPWTAIVWFFGPMSEQLQLLNRLHAEWRGALEVIEPSDDYPDLGVRISRYARDLRRNPDAEFNITMAGIERVDDAWLEASLA